MIRKLIEITLNGMLYDDYDDGKYTHIGLAEHTGVVNRLGCDLLDFIVKFTPYLIDTLNELKVDPREYSKHTDKVVDLSFEKYFMDNSNELCENELLCESIGNFDNILNKLDNVIRYQDRILYLNS